jgi:hypothetical protein
VHAHGSADDAAAISRNRWIDQRDRGVRGRACRLHNAAAVSHSPLQVLSAASANIATLRPAAVRGPEPRPAPAIGELASLVAGVASQLGRDRPPAMLAECTELLDSCLAAQRDAGRAHRDGSPQATRDELARLARMLTAVDPADVALVLRQIRRVLGRFDACSG